MTDERYTFEAARVRLEEIAALARKKDTSLEKSLDLLEEGVRLANICTELVDHTDLSATATVEVIETPPSAEETPAGADITETEGVESTESDGTPEPSDVNLGDARD